MNLYTRLINKDHPLPPDYVPENLTDIGIPFDAPCGDRNVCWKSAPHMQPLC